MPDSAVRARRGEEVGRAGGHRRGEAGRLREDLGGEEPGRDELLVEELVARSRRRRRPAARPAASAAASAPTPPVTMPVIRRYGVAPAKALLGSAGALASSHCRGLAQRVDAVARALEPMTASSPPAAIGLGRRGGDRVEEVGDRGATAQAELAADEVDGLDAVGALVDRGDADVAEVLGDAGLLDVAHAAVDLHGERRQLDADVGAPRLADRREQVGQLLRRRPHRRVGVVLGAGRSPRR